MAEADLTAAWKKDPNCGSAARGMLTVELGQGKGQEVMELWFRRAVAANPVSSDAYEAKLNYLQPKWHGTAEEQLAFAREVAATLPKTALARLILVVGHLSIAHNYGQDRGESERIYFKEHPEAWAEIKALAEDLFPVPEAAYWKVGFARIAVNADDMAAARRYGAGADPEMIRISAGTQQEYERLMKLLAEGK